MPWKIVIIRPSPDPKSGKTQYFTARVEHPKGFMRTTTSVQVTQGVGACQLVYWKKTGAKAGKDTWDLPIKEVSAQKDIVLVQAMVSEKKVAEKPVKITPYQKALKGSPKKKQLASN